MKKVKITKREVMFFILGIITMLIVDIIIDWEGSKKSFIDGWNSVDNETSK